MTKSKLFAIYVIVFLIFGVVFYDFIEKQWGFPYVDEILVMLLVVFTVRFYPKSVIRNKLTFIILFVFAFYTVYSFAIESNVTNAILGDLAIQIKPYLIFCFTIIFAPRLQLPEKRIIRKTVIMMLPILIMVALSDSYLPFFGHTARFATASIVLSLTYLYASKFTVKNIIISILILSIGLLSNRAKMYGFWGAFVLILLFFNSFELKVKLKNIIIAAFSISIIFWLSYEKLNFYFIQGSQDTDNLFARPALFQGAWEILRDDFPFGSGFGSFATYYSAQYYSPIYYKLGLNTVYGLSSDFPNFVSDSFLPTLAEFGIIGVLLFFYFWYYIVKKANFYKKHISQKNVKEYILLLLILVFFTIESVADSTFTHNRGVYIMMLLGLCFTDLKSQYEYEISNCEEGE